MTHNHINVIDNILCDALDRRFDARDALDTALKANAPSCEIDRLSARLEEETLRSKLWEARLELEELIYDCRAIAERADSVLGQLYACECAVLAHIGDGDGEQGQ